MEELREHKYFLPKEKIQNNDHNWFIENGAPLINAFRLTSSIAKFPDLRMYRQLLAYELSTATHPDYFWNEYDGDSPKPTEEDRKTMVSYLKFVTSFTGVLHSKEIEQIENGNFYEFMKFFKKLESPKPLTSRDELKQKILMWREEEYKIIAFQGSFDPPTETHLINATEALLLAQEQKLKFKIIFILDNDELIQRKAKPEDERPRVGVEKRREILESFWQVAGTCVSNVKSADDWWGYVMEYQELGVDHVLITRKQNQKLDDILEIEKRNIVIRGAKKKVLWLEEIPNGLTSTMLMERYKESLE
ncbi:MAG: hypothetical protein UT13_C0001G0701 [Candidatus Pacebacteria bacterium GW2011_GWF2_38_9]|nr:MAG: hypothetical protein US01_C0001G0732 [candidate division TM6 bacterium GW2011_GWF2_28_16]KKQ10097.1 MAG: hypothetical protein US20_C0003G0037 [Candidatus Pacebacteria bacterium GW2011_GWF1_36_5]KKQ89053.1 MAG: hypothetical protein UT13_C0001G0701 [Candidatus Pacebacteria bacterium GW2011_GWF2_38_9]HAZ73555.1 hypothetical protein [Candidatus Paceibacterota bacterium]